VLAVVRAVPGAPATPGEVALQESIWRRHTNRGPYSDRQIPASVRVELAQAAAAEHASMRLLDRDDVPQVLALAADASRELTADTEHRAELRRWVGVDRPDGIPTGALPLRRCARCHRYVTLTCWPRPQPRGEPSRLTSCCRDHIQLRYRIPA
jgi:hypothetical protein